MFSRIPRAGKSSHTTGDYAIIDASVNQKLLPRILEVDGRKRKCLLSGYGEKNFAAEAPWLVELDDDLERWLHSECAGLPWGIVLRPCERGPFAQGSADKCLAEIHRHLRRFLRVLAPTGAYWLFRFYDPRLLPVFITSCTPAERAMFFGAIESFWTPEGEQIRRPGTLDATGSRSLARGRWRLREAHIEALARVSHPHALEQLSRKLSLRDRNNSWTREGAEIVREDGLGKVRILADGRGLPAAIVSANGTHFQIPHDTRGRPVAFKNPDGPEVVFDYNEEGRLSKIGQGARCRGLSYDGRGRLAEIRHPDGTVERFSWSDANLLTSVIDREGARRELGYDSSGRPIFRRDPLGRETTFRWGDSDGDVDVCFPDGSVEKHSFDVVAGVALSVLPEGRRLVELDREGNPRDVSWGDRRRVRFHYNGDRIIRAESDTGAIECVRDARGMLVRTTFDDGHLEQLFDMRGRLSERRFPDGEVHQYHWDNEDHLIRIDAWGREINWRYSEGGLNRKSSVTKSGITILRGERTHEGGGRLSSAQTLRGDGSLLSEQKFSYDLDWRVAIAEDRCPAIGLWRQTRYRHGPEGRLLEFEDSGVLERDQRIHTFSYDAAGNMLSDGENAVDMGVRDQVLCHGGRTVCHDAGGRMTAFPGERGPISCRWAEEGHLLEVKWSDGEVHYEYDALGRRVSRRTAAGVWRYYWVEEQMVRERFYPADGSEPRTRTWLFTPPRGDEDVEQHAPIAVCDDGRVYWTETDARGAVIRVFNESSEVVWAAHLDPFGRTDVLCSTIEQPWRLLGHYEDADTRLCYNVGRWYSPEIRHYLSRDPHWEELDSSTYSYCGNDPLNKVDPLGRWAFLIPVAVFAVSVAVGMVVDYLAEEALEALGTVCAPCARVLGAVFTGLSILNVGKWLRRLPKLIRKLPEYWKKLKSGWKSLRKGWKSLTKKFDEQKNKFRKWWQRNRKPSDFESRPAPNDINKALDDIKEGRPRHNVRKPGEFNNDGKDGSAILPSRDADGNPITYTEHTVNPRPSKPTRPLGEGLDGKRIVEGSDGNFYWTDDHYKTFYRF